jgi:phosphohistidine phosphatase
MKRLYLMRHGHAPGTAEAGVPRDELRPLSDRGRRDARRMAGELKRHGGRPALILHSPLVRAVQTAAAAAEALQPASGAEPFAPLENVVSPEELLEALQERADGVDEVLAVGHQPQLGELAALLTRAVHELRPAGLIAVEFGAAPRLLWTASPDEGR